METNMDKVRKMTYEARPILKPFVQKLIDTGDCDKLEVVKILRGIIYRYSGEEDWAIMPEGEYLQQNLDAIDECVKICRETSYEEKMEVARKVGLESYPGDVSYLTGVLLSIVFKAVNEIDPDAFRANPESPSAG